MGTILNIVLLLGISFSLVALNGSIQSVEANHGQAIPLCSVGFWDPFLMTCLTTCPNGVDPADPHCNSYPTVSSEEYKCYSKSGGEAPDDDNVVLIDQFGTKPFRIAIIESFCASTIKVFDGTSYVPEHTTPNGDPNPLGHHLNCYELDGGTFFNPPIEVDLVDQFGEMKEMQVIRASSLCVPTDKTLPGDTVDEKANDDHFLCYDIRRINNPSIDQSVILKDQFGIQEDDQVEDANRLCTPVLKFLQRDLDAGQELPSDEQAQALLAGKPHLKGYRLSAPSLEPTINFISSDQFVNQDITIIEPVILFTQVVKTISNGGGMAVGGELIPLDSTMVLAAGAQYTAAWMIPVIVSGIGFAIVIARKF